MAAELKYFSDSLSGQTIKDAAFEYKEGKSIITFNMVSVENPVEIIVDPKGKIVFNFKGQQTVLNK